MSEAFYRAMKERKILQMINEYSEKHLKDFESSGLRKDTCKKAGYKSEKIGWTVPITNPFTQEEYYRRIKPDTPKIENENKANERKIKYLTPSGEKPHLYFSLQLDWSGILKDTLEIIVITEGEKKADKYIQDTGKPAVAVSGVWCWKSNGIPIDDLKMLCKRVKAFLIAIDSDYKEKPHVQKALQELIKTIEGYGCIAIDCSLPGPEKGLDDFLIARGKDELEKYFTSCMKLKTKQIKYDKSIEQAAQAYLQNPDMIKEFHSDMEKFGIVGEKENLFRIYLCCLSHKFESCLGLVLKGATSSGKTTIMKTVTRLMPEGIVHNVSSQSEKALNYWTDISHKIIVITEEKPPEDSFWQVMSDWRQLIEDNEITRVIVDSNEKDISKKRKEIKVQGPIVYLSTTTQSKLHEENENRLLSFNTDDSQEHVCTVIQRILDDNDNEDLEAELQFIIDKHRKAIEFLQPFKWNQIKIPFKKQIQFGSYGPEAMRDVKKLIKAVRLITFLHQYQREEFSSSLELPLTDRRKQTPDNYASIPENSSFHHLLPLRNGLISLLGDYNLAVSYFKDYFDANSSDISKDLQDKWNVIYKFSGDNNTFTYDDCKKKWNLKKSRVQVLVKEMLGKNMIVQVSNSDEIFNKAEGKKNQYRCIAWNLAGSGLTTLDSSSQSDVTGGRTNSEELTANSSIDASTVNSLEAKSTDITSEKEKIKENLLNNTKWVEIFNLIESSSTKTLLTHSKASLLYFDSDLVAIRVEKDMYLPRLEKDNKNKELILSAVKVATGLECKEIKFTHTPNTHNAPAIEI